MLANGWKRILELSPVFLFLVPVSGARAQENAKMGEVRFTADTQEERDAGVWLDGKYAGYVKELKGDRKVLLAPGEHEILIREAGYKDLTQKIVVAAGQSQTVPVTLEQDAKAILPGGNAADLRLDVQPKRAAVYVDGGYLGHGGDFGGRFHSMVLIPGKHRLKVELDGYRTYETEIDVKANDKSRMSVILERDSGATQAR
jgi:PEGA domain